MFIALEMEKYCNKKCGYYFLKMRLPPKGQIALFFRFLKSTAYCFAIIKNI